MDEGWSTEELAERDLQREALLQALEKLPLQLRQAVLLYYRDGLTYAEMSKRFNKAPSTVGRYTQEGIQLLQACFIQVEHAEKREEKS